MKNILKNFDKDITGIEVEDYKGNTIFIIDFKDYDIADVENYGKNKIYLRIQKNKQ